VIVRYMGFHKVSNTAIVISYTGALEFTILKYTLIFHEPNTLKCVKLQYMAHIV